MRRAGRRMLGAAAGLCLIGAPILLQLSQAAHRGTDLAGLLIGTQAAAIGFIIAGQTSLGRNSLWPKIAAGLAVFALTLLIWRQSTGGLTAASAVPHTLIFLGLLTVFALSLQPGRTPIITTIAARARGRLSPPLLDYTRHVTIAWCLFFALQLTISLLLAALAPLSWWQTYLNLGTWPMVAAMFLGELAIRHWRHGIHVPDDRGDALSRMRHMAAQFRAPLRQPEP